MIHNSDGLFIEDKKTYWHSMQDNTTLHINYDSINVFADALVKNL